MAIDEPPDGPAGSSHPPLTHNSNSYLGPIAAGAALREVRFLDDGRRITFYSYRAGTHMPPAAAAPPAKSADPQ